MTDIHIDDFYKDVGLIFSRLYSNFPRKTILYVDDICGADEPDEFGLHSKRFLSGFSAMVWLGDHDYLKYDTPIKQEALDQVVLTQRAFLLLSSRSELDFGDPVMAVSPSTSSEKNQGIPASVMEQSLVNINQLRKAQRSGSSIMIRQCIQYLLSQP